MCWATPNKPKVPDSVYWESLVTLSYAKDNSTYAKNLVLVKLGEKQISEDWRYEQNSTIYVHVGNICGRDENVSPTDFKEFRQFDGPSSYVGKCDHDHHLWKTEDGGALGCFSEDGKRMFWLKLFNNETIEQLVFTIFTDVLPGTRNFQLPRMCWGF
ncbi:hypothetical protein PROFUN_01283 [Planoprotostelium fungivorum]|uniref:Uncharacterized protein n=1 Tax=Planoprotostelium fungivorum TaxID=1890364 RepID=A0A2P6NZP5_9EUKA|nr:hypothetical protein PROFUN_01283 [Planoprotostelium fungivorum]